MNFRFNSLNVTLGKIKQFSVREKTPRFALDVVASTRTHTQSHTTHHVFCFNKNRSSALILI